MTDKIYDDKIGHIVVDDTTDILAATKELAAEINAVLDKYGVKECACAIALPSGDGRNIWRGKPELAIRFARGLAESILWEMNTHDSTC